MADTSERYRVEWRGKFEPFWGWARPRRTYTRRDTALRLMNEAVLAWAGAPDLSGAARVIAIDAETGARLRVVCAAATRDYADV